MPAAFKRFDVWNITRGGTTLTWDLAPGFLTLYPGPHTFTVQVSLSGAGAWELVGQTTQAALVDAEQRMWGRMPIPTYRVSLTAGGQVFYSRNKQGTGNLDGQDRAIVAAIVRKEQLLYGKAGACGYLYKRRNWGEVCTECVDQDTGDVIPGVECDTCYGTGFIGGYFDPIVYPVVESKKAQTQGRRLRIDMSRGTVDDPKEYVRGLACPWIDSRDVWIDADSDQRYIVGRIWSEEYRHIPIIFDPIELNLAPESDLVYSLPRPEDLVESSEAG